MLILAAIDIIGGECVRLVQGDYGRKKVYDANPVEIAAGFKALGASFLHIVDLDGAKVGRPVNFGLLEGMCNGLSLQYGGGIRCLEDAEKLFDLGVDRIIVGTSALKDKDFLKLLLDKFGADRVLVSIDAKNEQVLVEGWLEDGNKGLFEFLDELKSFGVQNIIFTDISRDGMLDGVDLGLIKRVIDSNLNVIVAGGVSSVSDLRELKALGVYGAIIGKALYEGVLDLKEALKFQENNLAKRVIACMDIADGRVVKGTCFRDLKDAGDAVELAAKYSEMGVDELVFLDITATVEGRGTLCDLVSRVAEKINIPFTVGGGISSVDDIRRLLNSGADKVSIGSAAVRNPELVSEAAAAFGAQCVVISVDAKKIDDSWEIFIEGGRKGTGIDVLDFVVEMERLGAGELLVNSLDRDGVAEGYDVDLLKKITELVNIPVIASSGAGKLEYFLEAFEKTDVDAVLAASVFHYGKIGISELKEFLLSNNIKIR